MDRLFDLGTVLQQGNLRIFKSHLSAPKLYFIKFTNSQELKFHRTGFQSQSKAFAEF